MTTPATIIATGRAVALGIGHAVSDPKLAALYFRRASPLRRKRRKGWRYASEAAVATTQGEIFASADPCRVVHETSAWRAHRRDA